MRLEAPTLDEYLSQIDSFPVFEERLPFDRMMFDVCGEANHVKAEALRIGGDPVAASRAFDRACARIYGDAFVSQQRKETLRIADWLLKAGYVWCVPGFGGAPTRWFDAWQRERNLALLSL